MFTLDRREAYIQEAVQQLEKVSEDDWIPFIEYLGYTHTIFNRAKGAEILGELAWRDSASGAANYDEQYEEFLEQGKAEDAEKDRSQE